MLNSISPLFSIIIPTFNRRNDLQQCLHQLKPENQKKVDLFGKSIDSNCTYEVIVSDDGNAEQTKKSLGVEYEWVKFKQGKKKGPAANRNNGAKHANGEWLVFTDDDCIPSYDWLHSFSSAISEFPKSNAFEGSIMANTKKPPSSFVECPININGGNFWSANIMVNKNLFFDLAGFDESFTLAANEDQDLYIRLKQHTTIPFIKNANVQHPYRSVSLFQKICKHPQLSQSYLLFVKKHSASIGISSPYHFLKTTIIFHSRQFYHNSRDYKIKPALFDLYCIMFIIYYFIIKFFIIKKVFQ